jgi:hypothetical protein
VSARFLAGETLEGREKELIEIIDKLKEEIKGIRIEMNSRGGRYVQMLTTVQQVWPHSALTVQH